MRNRAVQTHSRMDQPAIGATALRLALILVLCASGVSLLLRANLTTTTRAEPVIHRAPLPHTSRRGLRLADSAEWDPVLWRSRSHWPSGA